MIGLQQFRKKFDSNSNSGKKRNQSQLWLPYLRKSQQFLDPGLQQSKRKSGDSYSDSGKYWNGVDSRFRLPKNKQIYSFQNWKKVCGARNETMTVTSRGFSNTKWVQIWPRMALNLTGSWRMELTPRLMAECIMKNLCKKSTFFIADCWCVAIEGNIMYWKKQVLTSKLLSDILYF